MDLSPTLFAIVAITITIVLWYIYDFIISSLCCLTPKCIKATANIPGDPPWPYIFINPFKYFGTPESLWLQMRETVAKYPKIFKVWGVNRCAVVLMDPEDIEVLLTSNVNIEKSDVYGILQLWLRSGLLLSKGSKWKIRRKLLTPAFHFKVLKDFIPVFENCSENTKNFIKTECSKNSSDILSIVIEYALHSLCETTMGITISNTSPESSNYKNAIRKFGLMGFERLFSPWIWNDTVMLRTSFGQRFMENLQILLMFTKNVIDSRLKNWDKKRSVDDPENESNKITLPMLDLLIKQMKNGDNIDYEGIWEEVDTFMFEGHDTTGMALTFCLMLLANNKEAQDKIYEEQLEIFGNTNRKASYKDLQNMPYLERCIKESLRLYPSVPLIGRKLVEDLPLKNYTLPGSIDVFVLVYDLHRNPAIWKDPTKFDPDRFLPEEARKRHPFAYLPFSAGPRNCIGQRFAMMEMKSLVGKICRNYILEPIDTPESIIFQADIVLRPSNKNVKVKFRKRI